MCDESAVQSGRALSAFSGDRYNVGLTFPIHLPTLQHHIDSLTFIDSCYWYHERVQKQHPVTGTKIPVGNDCTCCSGVSKDYV